MIPESIDFPLKLRDRKARILHALDVLLGHDLKENKLASMQGQLTAMTGEMSQLHERLNENAKLVRRIHEMTRYDP